MMILRALSVERITTAATAGDTSSVSLRLTASPRGEAFWAHSDSAQFHTPCSLAPPFHFCLMPDASCLLAAAAAGTSSVWPSASQFPQRGSLLAGAASAPLRQGSLYIYIRSFTAPVCPLEWRLLRIITFYILRSTFYICRLNLHSQLFTLHSPL